MSHFDLDSGLSLRDLLLVPPAAGWQGRGNLKVQIASLALAFARKREVAMTQFVIKMGS